MSLLHMLQMLLVDKSHGTHELVDGLPSVSTGFHLVQDFVIRNISHTGVFNLFVPNPPVVWNGQTQATNTH